MPPLGAYAYGTGAVADTLPNFLEGAPAVIRFHHRSSGLATLTRMHSGFAWRSQLCLFPAPPSQACL